MNPTESEQRGKLNKLIGDYFINESLNSTQWNQGWRELCLNKRDVWTRKEVLDILMQSSAFKLMASKTRESFSKSHIVAVDSNEKAVFINVMLDFCNLLLAFHDEFIFETNLSKPINLMFDFCKSAKQNEPYNCDYFLDWKSSLRAIEIWMLIDSMREQNEIMLDARSKFAELNGPNTEDLETFKRLKQFKDFVFNDEHLKLDTEAVNRMLELTTNLMSKCKHLSDMFQPAMMIEQWSVGKELSTKQKDILGSALKTKLNRYKQINSISAISETNAKQYKAKFCVQWLIENVLKLTVSKFAEIPVIKLSPDRLSVRNDRIANPPIRSAFGVTSGVFFYEVTLISTEEIYSQNGHTHIGWTTAESRILGYAGIGTGDTSIALDVGIKHIRQGTIKLFIPSQDGLTVEPGDVIGCLIDADKSKFSFIYNGRMINTKNFKYSTLPYYASISLVVGQQAHFNFGQEPFKHPPDGIKYQNFHTVCEGDVNKYWLQDTERAYDGYYWHKQVVSQNEMQIFFVDIGQQWFNQQMKHFEEQFRSEKITYGMVDDAKDCFRFMQSIIEVLELADEKMVYLFVIWFQGYLFGIFDWIWSSTFAEMIYPYFQLKVTQASEQKHQNICVAFAHLIGCYKYEDYPALDSIQSTVFDYFVDTLHDAQNEWTKLFSMICLNGLSLSATQREILQNHYEIKQIIEWKKKSFEQTNVAEALNANKENLYNYQLYFLAKELSGPIHTEMPNHEMQATFNPLDKSEYIKLSSDLFSARNDSPIWQSVRSVCSVARGEIAYYEMIFLAPAGIRIGWSTKSSDVQQVNLGNDQTSIGFDSFYNLICYQDKFHHLSGSSEYNWNSGEVIGCLIDLSDDDKRTNLVSFFINGKKIESPIEFKLSKDQPYHVTVSLAPHQQCFCNFGQTGFKNAPKDILFTNLYQKGLTAVKTEIKRKPEVMLTNSTVSNAIFALNSNNLNTGDISFQSIITNQVIASTGSEISYLQAEIKCKVCDEKIQFSTAKRFLCCETSFFCHDCISVYPECPKCKKKPLHK